MQDYGAAVYVYTEAFSFFRNTINNNKHVKLYFTILLHFQEFLNWKWYVGGMLTLFVALFGLVANSMSMVVLFRPKIRAVAFNQLLFVLCGVDSFFLFCNSMSIGHALGLNNSKCDSKTFTENWDSKRHLLELSWPI